MRRTQFVPALTIFVLSACSNSTMMSSVAQVAGNAQNAKTAEMGFFQSIQASECRSDRITTLATEGPGGINAISPCSTPTMTESALQVREELMNSIVLYAQALSALEGVSTSDFDNYVKSAATQFGTDAKSGKFLAAFSADFSAGSAVTQALGQIMDWVVQFYRNSKVTEMAAANQKQLNTVIDNLELENGAEATNAAQSIRIAAQSAHLLSVDQRKAASAANALIIDQAFWGQTPTGSNALMAVSFPSPNAANDALEQLKACHDLVAAAGNLPGSKCKFDFIPLKTS